MCLGVHCQGDLGTAVDIQENPDTEPNADGQPDGPDDMVLDLGSDLGIPDFDGVVEITSDPWEKLNRSSDDLCGSCSQGVSINTKLTS